MNKVTQPIFKFERVRLGNKTTTQFGTQYGPYLYRDLVDNTLLASWDKPSKGTQYLYTGSDVGYNTDALAYYKNT